jgi:hypothetical protein
MKKVSLIILVFVTTLQLSAQVNLMVSDNKRFLVYKKDGKAFYWLGDTAWELFHRLTREQAEIYFKKRADQGFTVVQAVALAELDGLNVPNMYNEKPLINNNPATPNDAYFQHIDWVIKKAAEYNMYIALLPTWGDKVYLESWGVGPVIFNVDNAYTYGKWIGTRYKDYNNIIWMLGGDRNPRNDTAVQIWRNMARGIEEGVGGAGKALLTFHPQPTELADAGSSKWFHNDAWLDFNMFQTGHCRENNVWDRIKVAYDKLPVKPVFDGETIYEDHPVCFNAKDLGTSSAYDVRKHAYLTVFAGGFGNTYGCHDIWQFYTPDRKGINGPHIYWYDALDLPGANQMKFLKKLIESRPMLDRVPDMSLVVNSLHANDRIQATRGSDYAFIYFSQGNEAEIVMGKISGNKVKATWYNPRNGEVKDAGIFNNNGKQKVKPPTNGYGQDWVLILDDETKKYKTNW